jgi:hypothetical protein
MPDSCIGADAFYTGTAPASLSGAQGAQLYQMAAFSMAITDAAAKQSVLNAIRAKVGDDAFYTAMTAVIADPLQSQTLVTAYQNTARNVAQKISSSGLASLLPTPVPSVGAAGQRRPLDSVAGLFSRARVDGDRSDVEHAAAHCRMHDQRAGEAGLHCRSGPVNAAEPIGVTKSGARR